MSGSDQHHLRECPIEGCTTVHPRRHLMRKKHWRKVPRELQSRVWKTAKAMWAGKGTADWIEASDAAVAAVEEKEAKRVGV